MTFDQFHGILSKMFLSAIHEPQNYLAVFVMSKDGRAILDIIQNISYKFIELMSLEFMASPEEVVRQVIAYRYNALRH